jgi:hypothetical protein
MATSPNFGWLEPDNTDLVKNGALAIRTAVNAIDASMADLKGGTTGQVLAKATNTDMDFTWTTPSTAAGYADNPVLNSAMQIWQRGTSFAVSGSAAYTADRWQAISAAYTAGLTVSRQATNDTTNLPNIQYCARVQRDSGNTSTVQRNLQQCFESVNSIPFAGKTVTLSFYARAGANFSSASSSLSVQWVWGTGTDQNLYLAGYTGQTNISATTSVTLTTTWQRFTITGTVGATATEIGLNYYFGGVGTAGANDYFEVTGVQMEVGSTATPFHTNGATIQGELSACQRYYYRYTTDATTRVMSFGQAISTTQTLQSVTFPVTLRTRPTALEQSGTAAHYKTVNASAGQNDLTAVPAFDGATSNTIAFILTTSAGLVAGNASYLFSGNTSAYLGWSAEL